MSIKYAPLFRKLAPDEVLDFIKWARQNYVPGTTISSLWHPVVQDECALMNNHDCMGSEANVEAHFDQPRVEREAPNA